MEGRVLPRQPAEEQRAGIPPKPENFGQLSDEQLEHAAGGITPGMMTRPGFAADWVVNQVTEDR